MSLRTSVSRYLPSPRPDHGVRGENAAMTAAQIPKGLCRSFERCRLHPEVLEAGTNGGRCIRSLSSTRLQVFHRWGP